jgi:hypothetical protein
MRIITLLLVVVRPPRRTVRNVLLSLRERKSLLAEREEYITSRTDQLWPFAGREQAYSHRNKLKIINNCLADHGVTVLLFLMSVAKRRTPPEWTKS